MEKVTTRELYTQLQERIIVDLKEDEILCPDCKGLLFVFVENGEKGYINSCRRCYNGKLYLCKHCGKGNKTGQCDCKEAHEERSNAFSLKQSQKDFEAYQKAEKIDYKEYKGYYIVSDDEHLKEQDDLGEWIYEQLVDEHDVPEYLWAVEGTSHLSIDLKDVISDKCEDGYEDMYSHLDTGSPLLLQAQELIDQWEKEQGDSLCVFNETHKKAVIIKDLVEEIRKEVEKE